MLLLLLLFTLSRYNATGPRERRCSAPGGSSDEVGGAAVNCPGGASCECPEVSDGAESSEYEYDDDDMDSAFLAKEEEEFSQVSSYFFFSNLVWL